MSDDAADETGEEAEQGRSLVLYAFGETIMRFQLLELSFWQILAMRLRKGVTLDQGMKKVEGWDSQNMGRLVGALGLPDALKAEAEEALDARNYLAHRFMRDRAMHLDDAEACDRIADELVAVQSHLDQFEARLDRYLRDELGFVELTDEETRELGLDKTESPTWYSTET